MTSNKSQALAHIRVCDFTGQLAGTGATRFMAAFGAQIIRIEDPTNHGRWDILRGMAPYVDERRGPEFGGPFNNHNIEKLGITLNMRLPAAKKLLPKLIAISDVISENFAAGVFDRMGLTWEAIREINPRIIYVSNCGFGHTGPYRHFKTWGPSVQAFSGLTFTSGLPDQPPAGWGYSYMDHTGAYYMALAILMALYRRDQTGDPQYVDMATTEAATTLNGPVLLDYTVNGRPMRRPGLPHSNHNQHPPMAPHNIYPCSEYDTWVAIACRNDDDWVQLAGVINEAWCRDPRWATLDGRLANQDELDERMSEWTRRRTPHAIAAACQAERVPASAVQTPEQRIDKDPNTSAWGLWPEATHKLMGTVRVDGIPVHLSKTDWHIDEGGPVLGEDNDFVFGEILGLGSDEIASLREEGVL